MTDFEKIYRAYFNDVFYYIKRLSKSDTVAEEITGETFFKAMNALDCFRGDCDIRVWLCQIAKNCYFSYLKKQNHSISLEDMDNISTLESECAEETIEEWIVKQSDVMQIHMLLHDLQEPYKEVFMLRIFGELSFRQIGKIFSKTENWACVTYHRARNKIKEKMEDKDNEKRL